MLSERTYELVLRDDDLVRAEQAAALLTVSLPLLYRLLRKRELPCLRRGRTVRFRVRDLHDYVMTLRETGGARRKHKKRRRARRGAA